MPLRTIIAAEPGCGPHRTLRRGPGPPAIDPDTSISNIDLDEETFVVGGERLDEQRAAQIAADTLARARRRNLIPGGKSLSKNGSHSPQLHVRVPQELIDQTKQLAAQEGISVSKLTRRALEELVAKAS